MNIQKTPAMFDFQETKVCVFLDEDQSPWWVADDICQVLGYSDTRQVVEKLDDDEKMLGKIYRSSKNREMWLINESGLYTLIIRSNKEEAKPFRRWVTHDVLPSLRKNGYYRNDIIMKYTLPECRTWVKTFEEDFYREIYRLMGWQWGAYGSKHPPYCSQITNKWIYELLPDGVNERIGELNTRSEKGFLRHKKHQFLSQDQGLEHLRAHLMQLTRLMRAAHNWDHFEEMGAKAFGLSLELGGEQLKLMVVA